MDSGWPVSDELTTTVVPPTASPCQNVVYFYTELAVAAALIIALSFFVRRKIFCTDCCFGRPGVLQPINLIDEFSRRWSFVACFIAMAADILGLLLEAMQSQNVSDLRTSWLQVFLLLLWVVLVCIIFYPLFACLTHRRNIIFNVAGFAYAAMIAVFDGLNLQHCCNASSGYNKTSLITFQVPRLVACCLLMLTYLFDLTGNVRRFARAKQNNEADLRQILIPDYSSETTDDDVSECLEYVHNLMQRHRTQTPPRQQSQSIRDSIKFWFTDVVTYFKYRRIPGFRFPPRLVCTLAVCALTVCWLVIRFQIIIDSISRMIDSFLASANSTSLLEETRLIQQVTWSLSSVLSGAVQLCMIAQMLATYKERWQKYIRGSHKLHKKLNATPSSIVINGMHYPGYQIPAFIFGFFFVTLVFEIILLLFVYLIVLPIRSGDPQWLLSQVVQLWPLALVSLIIYIIQVLLCKYFFLHDRGRVLALRHRKLFHVMGYFFFIFGILIGLFASIKRILISIIANVLLMSRLDHIFLVKGFERFDSGHVAYMSMVVLDVCHNHPVLRTFIDLLQHTRTERLKNQLTPEFTDINDVDNMANRRRLRNRWLKLLTLINNPSLALEHLKRSST